MGSLELNHMIHSNKENSPLNLNNCVMLSSVSGQLCSTCALVYGPHVISYYNILQKSVIPIWLVKILWLQRCVLWVHLSSTNFYVTWSMLSFSMKSYNMNFHEHWNSYIFYFTRGQTLILPIISMHFFSMNNTRSYLHTPNFASSSWDVLFDLKQQCQS